MQTIAPGEIVYCDLEVETIEKKPVRFKLDRVSLSVDYNETYTPLLTIEKHNRILSKFAIKTDCKIIKLTIHHSSGFKIKKG